MLKIIKLSRNLKDRCVYRFWSSNAKRYQFRREEPIYYPKRDVTHDNLIGPLVVSEKAVTSSRSVVPPVDYYKILGVNKKASPQEIKTAYYNLAKKFHPDVQPTPQETKSFQQISEAYHVLSDDSHRHEYDKYGTVKPFQPFLNEISLGTNHPTVETTGTKKKPNFLNMLQDDTVVSENKVPLRDIPKLVSKNETELDLKFLQAVQGGKEYVDLKAMIKCPRCNGSARLGSQINIEFCQKCGGTGQFRVKGDDYLKYKVCNCCSGKRYVQKNDCSTCENRGFVVQSQRVEVNIPPGIANGEVLKITNPLNQQIVKVRVNVDKSIYFKRDGNNVATDKFLTISQAVLGGKFKIRGLYEDLEVNLGPGVESHTTYCFKGKGISSSAGLPGDHIVTFKIRVPKNLTTKQRQLILALSRTEDPTFDGQ